MSADEPSGYLPERAAKRARKIVLRAPMGMHWILGSAFLGLVIIGVGLFWLLRDPGVADRDFEIVGAIDELTTGDSDRFPGVFFVVGVTTVAFIHDGFALSYCETDRTLYTQDGGVWNLAGRGFAGRVSLDTYPTAVVDGDLLIDRTTITPGPPSSVDPRTSACSPR